MAYKSKISNKRYGTTFGGKEAYDLNSPLGDVVNSIKEITPQLRLASATHKDIKIKEAQEAYEALINSNKTPDQIDAEIKQGLHPKLSGIYTAGVIQKNRGRFDAAKVQQNIIEKLDEFDPLTMNFDAWAQQFMPVITDKSTSYNEGFSHVYEQFRADQVIKESEAKYNDAIRRKTENGIALMNTVPKGEVATNYYPLLNSLNEKVVHEDGTVGDIYSTQELNDIAYGHALNIGNRATTTEEIDYAIDILIVDRGKGKGGNNIGSLLNTENAKVSQLYGELLRKKITLQEKGRTDEKIKKEEDYNILLAKSLLAIQEGTYSEIQEEMKTAVIALDPTFFGNYMQLTSVDYQGSATVNENKNFEMRAISGGFRDANEILAVGTLEGISTTSIKQALAYNADALKARATGVLPIQQTNVNYTKLYADLSNIIDINMITGEISGLGILDDAEGDLLRYATGYVTTTIQDAELKWKEQDLTDEELNIKRQKLSNELNDYIYTRFGKNTEASDTPQISERQNPDREAFFVDELGAGTSFAEIQEDRRTIQNNIAEIAGQLDINDTFENNMEKIQSLFTSESNQDNYIDLFEYVQNITNNNIEDGVEGFTTSQVEEYVTTGVYQLFKDLPEVGRQILTELDFINENSTYQEIQDAGTRLIKYLANRGEE
tara:strand:+ start:378 stop:2366 length:1989 start_codon:yes stop_codon:yes gene_type:complete